MAVELRVLGPLEVVGADGPVVLPGRKHRVLLSALVLASGRACSTDALADAVWGEAPPASARKLVQLYVSQLRKVLPAGIVIVSVPAGYALELEAGALDSASFVRLAQEAHAALDAERLELTVSLAERALRLWRGPAFADLAHHDSAQASVLELEELRIVATEDRLDALLRLGRHEQTLGEVLALADAEPLRERPQSIAMLALYRAGRQTEALDRYAAHRDRLDDELGLQPGPAVRDLQRRILQQDPSLEAQRDPASGDAARSLPSPATPLVGRERELEVLAGLLARREHRLIVLSGAGGSGKTRLAFEAARRAAPTFAHGALLVELAPVRDPELVPRAIADAIRLADADDDGLVDALAHALAERELLLVVDNAEHVRAAASTYVRLVERAPRLTILVTSRAVLHLSGEHVVPVAPLDLDAAVTLFAQRAAALDPSFSLSEAMAPAVEEICRRVDGLPLAIELAAARIRTLTPELIRDRLVQRLQLLTAGPRDLPARQQTLRDTIAWSVDLLSDQGKSVFARLAVFPAGATLEASESVCGGDIDTLAELVDDNLARRESVAGKPRFDMLETVREYALELLGDGRRDVELAMAAHLAELAEAVEIEARSRAQALARLDPELDNIRAALDACAAADEAELELRLAGGIWRYWWIRGVPAEGIRHIDRALRAGAGTATTARAQALRGAAGLAWVLGDLDRARELATAAIPVAMDAGSAWDEMAANTVLGVVANVEGDRELARRHHLRSMQLAEQQGLDPIVQKLNLANIALDDADYAEARTLLEDVLATHRQNANVEGVGTALLNLGVVYYGQGEHERSFEAFREARTCFEEVGFRAHVAHAVQGIAAFEASQGRFEEAARLLGQARGALDDIGAPEDDFAELMIAWTRQQAVDALGPEAFEDWYASGHEGAA